MGLIRILATACNHGIARLPNSVLSKVFFSKIALRVGIAVVIVGLGSEALAQSALPTLTSLTRTSAASIAAGSAVTYTVGFTAGTNALTSVQVTVTDTAGTSRTLISISPVSGATLSLTANSTWLNGAYTVDRVSFGDNSGRFTFYYRNGTVVASPALSGAPTIHSINLAAQDFQLSGGASSTTLPTLTSLTRTSAASIAADSAVTYTVGFTAGTNALTSVQVTVTDSAGTSRTLISTSPVSGATLSLTTNSSWLNGAYTVDRVSFSDNSGRFTFYYRNGTIVASPALSGAPTNHSINLAAQDFQLSGGASSTTLPTLTSLTRTSAATIAADSAVTYTVGFTAGTNALTSVQVTVTDSAGTSRTLISTSPVSGATLSLTTNSSWLNGAYTVDRVSFGDNSGRFTFYYRNGTIAASPALSGAPTTHSINLAAQDFQLGTSSGTTPNISTQPVSQSVVAGGTASFSVTASGTPPLSYQWKKNGSAIAGATDSTLFLSSAQNSDAGNYTVTVSNGLSSVTSSTASLTVNVSSLAPSFLSQPSNATAADGGGFTVNVQVATSNFSVVTWKANVGSKTLNALSSATVQTNNLITASIAFGPVTIADAGTFQVLATNDYGSTFSAARTLIVSAVAPTVTTQPADQTVVAGSHVTLTVSTSGTVPLAYQWRKNGTAIFGATSTAFDLASAQLSDAGSYTVIVSNSVGSTTSSTANLTVSSVFGPTITAQPSSQTVVAGSSVTFTVVATGTAPFAYQWLKNGTAISGATGAIFSLAIAQVSDAGSYTVMVSNSAASTTSTTANLAVSTNSAPTITAQPSSQTVDVGSSVTFAVAATGTAPLVYQWRKNGVALAGATNPYLLLTNAAATDVGAYTVSVSNSAGAVSSAAGNLSVNSPMAPTITTQPLGVTAQAGTSVRFTASASGTAPLIYQWYKNSVAIMGATSSSLTLANISVTDGADYSMSVGNSVGTVWSSAATLAVVVPNPARLVNLSILTSVAAGDSFTLGFVVGGSGSSSMKPLLFRVAGPSLAQFGVTDPHSDPKLELFSGTSKVDENDNWGSNPTLGATFDQVGAFHFSPANSRDAALYTSAVAAGGSSIRVSGVGPSSGTVLAELYETTAGGAVTSTTPRLINVSVLKNIDGGLTAGFVIGGLGTKSVLVRAIGPTLTSFGVTGALADPALALFNAAGATIGGNDNWDSRDAGVMAAVGAFALPSSSKDAAYVASLSPGSYTIQVHGAGSSTGAALVEVYEVP